VKFEGLSKDEKATAVLAQLSVDREVTIHDLLATTGLTMPQIHQGIRQLREAQGEKCVITVRRGPAAAYKLAADAPEVRDYAEKRMRHWQVQIGIIHNEMEQAQRLLPGAESIRVKKAAEVLTSLLRLLELDEQQHKEDVKREKALVRRERKLAKR
jgi:hypothetical protein